MKLPTEWVSPDGSTVKMTFPVGVLKSPPSTEAMAVPPTGTSVGENDGGGVGEVQSTEVMWIVSLELFVSLKRKRNCSSTQLCGSAS
jgi:hypothetical protein